MAEKQVNASSAEELTTAGKEQKRKFVFIFFSFLIFGIACLIISSIAFIKNDPTLIGLLIVGIISIIISFAVMPPKMFKWDYRQWAHHKFKQEIKSVQLAAQTAQEKLEEMQTIDGKIIQYTKIIDSYTEYTDKLHAFLNYQEVIQHRMYKFLVIFDDNTQDIYTAEEGTKVYNKLVLHLKQETSGTPQQENRISSADEILKYKRLLDEGIITQEEFNKKKEELLNK